MKLRIILFGLVLSMMVACKSEKKASPKPVKKQNTTAPAANKKQDKVKKQTAVTAQPKAGKAGKVKGLTKYYAELAASTSITQDEARSVRDIRVNHQKMKKAAKGNDAKVTEIHQSMMKGIRTVLGVKKYKEYRAFDKTSRKN